MNIEAELKNLRSLKADEEFKQNLRIRILNEYSFIHTQKSEQNELPKKKTTILGRTQDYILDTIYGFLKFNSAVTLSLFFLLFVSIGSYASIFILPDNVKTTVTEGFKSINKPKVDFEVVSNIDGASVYINNKYVGLTPLDIDVKEGAYSVRVEKDGYITYESEISLDTARLSNKLNIELPKQVTANSWTKYQNNENNVSFFYPDSWNLIEKKLENKRRLSQIIIENGNTSLGISLNDHEDLKLSNTNGDKIFVGEIKLNDKVYKRYLVFNQFDEFAYGGIWIEDGNLGNVKMAYNFDDLPSSQILSSQQLNLLDQIAISYLSSQAQDYVYNPDTFKYIENKPLITDSGTDNQNEENEVPENIDGGEEEVINKTNEYINNVYGYKLSLPDKWFVSSSRAEYPLYDRGHLIEKDGKSYKVARLKIFSDKQGIIYIFMTNNESYDINDGGNLCNQQYNKKVITMNDNVDLVGSSEITKYKYQLCNKTSEGYSSEFTTATTKNGKIKYTIYWDAAEAEIIDSVGVFQGILDSFKFDDSYINTPINKVEYSFKENGIAFNYNYALNIVRSDIDCVEPTPTPDAVITTVPTVSPTLQIPEKCRLIKVTDNSGNALVDITVGGTFSEPVANEGELINRKRLKNVDTNEVYTKLQACTFSEFNEETCELERFNYGLGKISKSDKSASIKYYKNTEEVYSILNSLQIVI